jgi:KDO2-lipid IV(A) lauroyltransferase
VTLSAVTDASPRRADRRGRPPRGARPATLLRLRYALETAGVGAAARAVQCLPRRAALALGRTLGTLGYWLLPADRRVARANVEIVFGDSRTPREKSRIARAGGRLFGAAAFSLLWAPRLTPENVRDHIDFNPDADAFLRAALDRGRGVIFCTTHYGDWELMAASVGFVGTKLMNVAEPLRNASLEALVIRLRAVSGHAIVPPRFAVLKLFKHLRRGGSIGMLIDVNGRRGRGGVWLDFFGLPVFNSPAVAELAIRTGATILFVYAEPLPGGRSELVVEPPVEVSQTGDHAVDVRETSQRCLDRAAALIRRRPEHWLWTYKRWKRRPSPEQGRFPFYSKYDPRT